MNITIRNERKEDYRAVEEMTREAFYNLYVPGCSEHYLVHTMRNHPDFVPELDFVLEADGQLAGNIMYTKAKLTDQEGNTKDILTFGPLTVAPQHQRRGYGKMLMAHSFQKALEMEYDTVVIFGGPKNYVTSGFVSCKKLNVSLEGEIYPASLLVKELVPGALEGKKWQYEESPATNIDEAAAEAFDASFEYREKCHMPSQDEFYIMSHSLVML